MDLPLYDIGGLLQEEQVTIEQTSFTDPMGAKSDIIHRLEADAEWSMCIIQQERGMLLIGEKGGDIHGVLYPSLTCGAKSHPTRVATVILALLLGVETVNKLYTGTLTRYSHVIVRDLMSESPSVEIPD